MRRIHSQTAKGASSIAALNPQQFQVRQNLSYVHKYSDNSAFQSLEVVEAEHIISHLAGLIPPIDEDETARRLDVLMYRMILAKAEGDDQTCNSITKQVQKIAASLSQKGTIPEVIAAKDTLAAIQTDAFWQTAALTDIDQIREEIRGLMRFLKREMKTKVINITDAVLFEREGERFTAESNIESYYERASRYVTENEDNPALHKLKNNIPLSPEDWSELEGIFWHEVGTKEEYEKLTADKIPLGKFVRSLTGLSHEAAHTAFSEFLDTGVYTEAQIHFVHCVMDWIITYGTLGKEDMRDPEFAGGSDIVEVFGDHIVDFQKIMAVIDGINTNAMPLAA